MTFTRIAKAVFSHEIAGIPVLATLIGSFMLMSTMFMWYGSFFVDLFHPLMGITEADVTAEELGLWYPIGIVLTMAQGLGVALLLKWRGWPGLLDSAMTAVVVALLFGATTFSYPLVILPEHNVQLFLINVSGLLTAWVLCALIISALRLNRLEVRPASQLVQLT